jgi:hypothetical protein
MMQNSHILVIIILIMCGMVSCSSAQEGVTGPAWVSITSVPSGATASIDGTPIGNTPVTNYQVSSGSHFYGLSKPGYVLVQQDFSVEPGEHKSLSYTMQSLNPTTRPTTYPTTYPTFTTYPTTPPSGRGSIYATSTPTGAAIYLNGQFQGYSPLQMTNLKAATYTVLARLEGYSDYSAYVTVYNSQESNFYAPMQQSPVHHDYGYISISSNPSGAQAYVDGTYRGSTPITVSQYPGTRTVLVKMAGYYDYSQQVNVVAYSTSYVTATLSPVSQSGSILVSSSPSGVNIYLDGNYRGQTDSSGNYQLQNVASGSHQVKGSRSGYYDSISTVNVVSGTQAYLQMVLVPIGIQPTVTVTTSPPSGTGALSVSSTPSGAEVYVDNVYRGYSPATISDLSTGFHSVTVKLSGYNDAKTDAQVVAGVTTPVVLQMSPQPTQTKSGLELSLLIIPAMLAGLACIFRERILK